MEEIVIPDAVKAIITAEKFIGQIKRELNRSRVPNPFHPDTRRMWSFGDVGHAARLMGVLLPQRRVKEEPQ